MPTTDPEKRRAYQRQWIAKNRDKARGYWRKYVNAHAEERKAYNDAYRKNHPEKVRDWNQTQAAKGAPRRAYLARQTANQERTKLYNRVHAEERKLYTQAYRAKNPEKVAAWKKADYARRPGEDNARRRARKAGAAIHDLTAAQWREIKAAYAHRCAYCGRKMKHLTQDHLTPISRQGNHTVMNVVPACQSCNSRKYNGAVLTPIQPLLLTIAPAKKKAG